jgi:ribosomal protein S18 acetylase RimI-like enzyme
MSVSLRPYQLSDFAALSALWQATLGTNWPLTPQYLARMTTGSERYRDGDHIVAEQDGQVVGFVATRLHTSRSGGIPLLVVRPESQRQGIGTMLHEAAFGHLRQQDVTSINFTSGGDPFWPGVPLNSEGAVEFFRASGWDFPENNYDLTRDLKDYQTPAGVLERVIQQGFIVRPTASREEASAVVEFEERHFPFWTEYFVGTAEDGRYRDIIAAWEDDQVVGSLLINNDGVPGLDPDTKWHTLLGDDMGGIGAVGTNEAYERRGIGLSMVAAGSEILKARGVGQCIIGWTDLTGFYGKLGYTIWREYAMAESR